MHARKHLPIVVLLIAWIPLVARAADKETVTVATYNVELFHQHFVPTTQKIEDKDLKDRVKKDADKDLWMISEVILDPKFNPDILVIEECCEQDELDKFNKKWLKNAYATVIVFPTNSDRHQQLAMMLKPGFKVIEKKDQYYLEKDPGGGNERGDRLFARGPSFCKVQTPSGYEFWVGVTHMKSKHGNSVDVTKWRLREATRTHQIIKELEAAGPKDVMLLGDCNDELGMQEFEQEAGGDSIGTLVGPESDGLTLVTKPLIDAGKISYGGYENPRFRAFIDQIIITPSMKDQVQDVEVFTDGLARAASDHYPVFVKITSDSK